MWIWKHLRYWLFRFLIFACRHLPARFLYWIALRVADLNYLCDRRGRMAVQANLRQALPDASEARLRYESRWVFRNFGKYITEFFRFRKMDRDFYAVHTALIGQEHLDAALAGGRGCIIVAGHLSNWELGVSMLSRLYDYPVTVIVAMHRDKRVNDLFMRERAATGIQVVDIDDSSSTLQLMRALKNGGIVGILGDRDPTGGGVAIDFFGRPCRFPQGPARLALATGAPILFGHGTRRCNDSFSVELPPPIEAPARGPRGDKVLAMTQGYARRLEDAIRRHPEEWPVFYPIWEKEWQPR